MNALSYKQGLDDGIRMATLKEKRKLKAYKKAVKNVLLKMYRKYDPKEKYATKNTSDDLKLFNAEYRRILKDGE